MRFYIATQLERAEFHHQLRDALQALGHQLTYDWTVHGSVQGEGEERYTSLAKKEADGVLEADVVIVLLPGGPGTHTELGMALGAGKRIILHTFETVHRDLIAWNNRTCIFYWHPKVEKVFGGLEDVVQQVQAGTGHESRPKKGQLGQ